MTYECNASTHSLPWLHRLETRFLKWQRLNRLPHAMILNGDEGLGLSQFVQSSARKLLCQAHSTPCGHCQSCQLFEYKTHPDFMTVSLEEGAKQLKIDQIRAVQSFLQMKPLIGRYRVVSLEAADTMNEAAQNALLKTLEEPPEGTLIFLSTRFLHRLLPTVRSRCQVWQVKPQFEEAESYLKATYPSESPALLWKLSGGRPLAVPDLKLRRACFEALERGVSPIQWAEHFSKEKLDLLVDWFYQLALDAMRLSLSQEAAYHVDYLPFLKKRVLMRSVSDHEQFLKKCVELKRSLSIGTALNPTLLLEDLMISFAIGF